MHFQPGDFTGLGSEGVEEALWEWLVGTVSRVSNLLRCPSTDQQPRDSLQRMVAI